MVKKILPLLCICSLTALGQSNIEMVIQSGHSYEIRSIDISPDGRLIASAGGNSTILWDFKSGIQLRSFEGHSAGVESVAFLPDYRYLITGSRDKTIKLWEVESGNLIHTFEGHNDGISCVSVSKSGLLFATSSWDTRVMIWDISDRKWVKLFAPNADYLLGVAFSPDESKIATAAKDGSIRIIELNTEREVKKIAFNTEGVVKLTFSNDGNYIAAGGLDGQFKVIEWRTGKVLWSAGDYGKGEIRFSADDEKVAYGGLLVRNWRTGDVIAYASGHYDRVTGISFSPDSRYVLSGGFDKKIIVWDVITKSAIRTIEGSALGVTAGDYYDGTQEMALATTENVLKIWDLKKLKPKHTLIGHSEQVRVIQYSPDGSRLASASRDKSGKIWDINSGKIVAESIFPDAVSSTAFSDNGQYVAFSGEKNLIRLYDNTSLTMVKEFSPKLKDLRPLSIRGLDFSDDSKTLVSGHYEGFASIWKIPGCKETAQLPLHEWYIADLKISHDGTRLLTASADGFVKITDLVNGKQIGKYAKLDNYYKYLNSVAFSPDEKMVVAGYVDNSVMLFSTETEDRKELRGHTGSVSNAHFTKDGNEVFSYGGYTANIWSKESELKAVFINTSEAGHAVVTPEGYYTFSKQGHHSVHFVRGLKSYSFENFDLIYNRPDKIMESLGKSTPEMVQAYRQAWEKRVKKMGFDPVKFEGIQLDNIPKIYLTDVPSAPENLTTPFIQFTVTASDDRFNLERLFVTINGVPEYGIRGLDLKDQKRQNITQSVSMALSKGKNTIRVSVMNEKGVESLSEQFEVVYAPSNPRLPTLHVVSIGLSKFVESDYNLTYADKDANDLVALMKNAPGYGQVVVHSFTNEQATTANILKIRAELEKTKVDDEVVVFLASHGLLDEELDYYIAMHNTDFENPKVGGLRYDLLENLIDGIPARNKLMLIDACHSGEVDKEESTISENLMDSENPTGLTASIKSRGFKTIETKSSGIGLESSFDLMKELFADLRRNNGAIVISSASGKEFAFESPEWNNGVFTYSLLEGLKSGKADINKDNTITVSEVRDYVGKRVVELTDGKQNPTSRTENLENDFRVW